MKKKAGKIIVLVVALLVVASLVYTRWPVSLEKVIGADPASVKDLTAYSVVAGAEEGTPYIHTTMLPYQAQEANEAHFITVMELLQSTDYRPSLRNLLPWPQYIENLNDYDGTSVWVNLNLGEDSCRLVFYGEYVGLEPESDRGGFTLYRAADSTVRTKLLEYVAEHGWSDASPVLEAQSEEEILALFAKTEHGDCPVLDCVPVTDGAYGMVGVVLYWDEDRASTIVSFLAADGTSQEAGPAARAVEPPELTYVGEGTVVFLLEKEDGSTTNYALTLSIDGEAVHFEAQEGNMLLLP